MSDGTELQKAAMEAANILKGTEESSMITIWFAGTLGDTTPVRLDVSQIEYARRIWDKLKSAGFDMRSTRP